MKPRIDSQEKLPRDKLSPPTPSIYVSDDWPAPGRPALIGPRGDDSQSIPILIGQWAGVSQGIPILIGPQVCVAQGILILIGSWAGVSRVFLP